MRILSCADLHLKLKHDKRYKRDLITSLNFLVDTIESQKPEFFIVAGDIFDTKYPTATEYAVFTAFLNRISKLDVHTILIPGNHDTPNNSEEANTLKQFFNLKIDNLTVIHKPGIYNIYGLNILAIPYVHYDREEVLQMVKQLHDEYVGNDLILVGHFWVDSYKIDNQDYTQNIHEFVVSEAYLKSLNKVKYYMLGHIHIGGRVFGNCYYLGSVFRTKTNETEPEKSILLFEDDKVTKIVSPAMGIKEVLISSTDDLNIDLSGITSTICHLKVKNLDIEFMSKINAVRKQLVDQGNYVYTDMDLKTIKFNAVTNSKPENLSQFFTNWIKMNNLMAEETTIKTLIQGIINGNITEKTNFFDIKELNLK
jgi:DNA repair exonuclease SbcCD nuclease subunit